MTEGTNQQRELLGGEVFDVPALVAAAHELKAPLALIRQLSLYSQQTEDSAYRDTMLRQIHLTSERALRLTTDLTRATRLEDSLFSLEPLNPLSLCDEVVREMQPLYTAQGKQVRLARRTRPLLGVANRDLLRRILMNFVDNALHYSRTDQPVVISAALRNGGTSIRLGVRDYGPMIPSRVWEKLQDKMGTSAQPLHSRPQSSGLGLLIAKRFAVAMHAELGALRHRDGATFYVDIDTSTQLRLL